MLRNKQNRFNHRSSYLAALTSVLLLFTQNAQARWGHWGSWWYSGQADNGLGISLKPNKGSYKSGETVTIQGEVSRRNGYLRSWLPWQSSSLNSMEIRGFFPDKLTEIPVTVNRYTGKFELTLPALKVDALNLLTVTIGKAVPAHVRRLERLESKLDFFVSRLDRHIAKLRGKKHVSEEHIAALQAQRDRLAEAADTVRDLVEQEGSTISTRSIGLLVDNNDVAPGEYSILLSGFRHSLSTSFSTLIQGQAVTVRGKIQNLRSRLGDAIWEFPCHPGDKYVVKLFLNDQHLKDLPPTRLDDTGEFVTFEETLTGLRYQDENTFRAELHRVEKVDKHTGAPTKLKEYGELQIDIPVIRDSKAPTWLANGSPNPGHPYVRYAEAFDQSVFDEFGRIDLNRFAVNLQQQPWDASPSTISLLPELAISSSDGNRTVRLFKELSHLPEGRYTLTARAQDLALNFALPNPLSLVFEVDQTPPAIALSTPDNILTNNPLFSFTATTTDRSPFQVTAFHDNTQVAQGQDVNLPVSVVLREGINTFEISAVDAALNQSEIVRLNNIELDTIPAVLSNVTPSEGAILRSLDVAISGQSNEPLSFVSVNGTPMTLSENKLSFSGTWTATGEGAVQLEILAYDLATNLTRKVVSAEIVLRVINGDLLTVYPDQDGVHLWIKGMVNSTRPGANVAASGSFINFGSAVAAADGTFAIRLNPFTEATVTATATDVDRSDTVTVTYQRDTRLAGNVRDTSDHPLKGVRVTIAGTNLSVFTDESGTFVFNQPVTGDQILHIDGSTWVQPAEEYPRKRFFQTSIGVSVGISNLNVISRPVYLHPLVDDHTAVEIVDGVPTTVTSPNAPGVVLEIPANGAVFPGGGHSGKISIAEISSNFSTIAPRPEAVPDTVYAMEPTGLFFPQRIDIEFPNVNELPAGVQVVFISQSTPKGTWEIDGVGEVTADGQKIRSKPGQGISHFSIVYPAVLGPKIAKANDGDRPNVNVFDGSSSQSIQLPTYRSLGQDITPSLNYKSTWARPNILVSNVFKIPREEVNLPHVGASAGIFTLVRTEVGIDRKAWWQPDYISAQLFTTDLTSDADLTRPGNQPMIFGRNPENPDLTGNELPNEAVISYALDLKNQSTGSWFASGLYPYQSHYEIHLKRMMLSTTTTRKWEWFGQPKVEVTQSLEAQALDQAFPNDLAGTIPVQNYVQSPAGKGWRVGGVQRILNPQSSTLLLEESDGSLTQFALNNTIETLANLNGTGAEFLHSTTVMTYPGGVDLSQWPIAYVAKGDGGIGRVDLASSSPSLSTVVSAPGTFWSRISSTLGQQYSFFEFFSWHHFTVCWSFSADTSHLYRKYSQLVATPDGRILSVSPSTHELMEGNTGNGQPGRLISTIQGPPTYFWSIHQGIPTVHSNNIPPLFDYHEPVYSYCRDSLQVGCQSVVDERFILSGHVDCPARAPSFGTVPVSGSGVGSFGGTTLNRPMGLTAGSSPNTLALADYGNHRVLLLNLSSNSTQVLAGNGANFDSGENIPATQAGVYHPRSVVYDAIGNLYISTEGGSIRKVDTLGNITYLVGAPGATPGDNLPARKVRLLNPFGMVVDNSNGYLYVAESGGHSVRRIDFSTGIISTVAGGASPGFSGDGGPATLARLNQPTHLGLDPDNNLLVADAGNSRIRRVVFQNSSSGTLAYALPNTDPNQVIKQSDGTYTKASLVRLSDGTWQRRYRNGGIVLFDNQGRQSSARDLMGNETVFTYDANTGGLASVTDPTGRTLRYIYLAGKLATIRDPAGRETQFRYSGDYLTEVIFPDGSTNGFTYNSQGLLTDKINGRGHVETRFGYNEWSRLSTIERGIAGSSPALTRTELSTFGDKALESYYRNGEYVSYSPGESQAYDGIKDSREIETKFLHDSNGWISTMIDGVGRATRIVRDSEGRTVRIQRNFIENNPDIATDDEFDSEVITQYDTNTGDLIYQGDSATGIATSRVFNERGNVTSETNGRGLTTLQTFDPSSGLLLSKTDPLGNVISFTYGAYGLQESVKLNGILQEYARYDASGFRVARGNAAEEETTFSYNLAGYITSAKDPKQQVTSYERSAWNKINATITPKNERTEYSFWPTGELYQVKNPKGHLTTFEHDALSRVIAKTDPLGNRIERTYDGNGNVLSELDANGNLKQFVYDHANRLSRKILPDETVVFGYDVRDHVTSAQNGHSLVEFSRDVIGRVTSTRTRGLGVLASLPDVTITYEHDRSGNVTKMTDSGGVTRYGWDELDRLTSVTNPYGEVFTYSFDSLGRPMTLTRPASRTEFSFDSRNYVSRILHTAGTSTGGPTIQDLAYTRNELGLPTEITKDGATSRVLSYDGNQQLVGHSNSEVESNSTYANETFNYDNLFNRIADQNGLYEFDPKGQQLLADYRYFYVWDQNGNLISKQSKGMQGEVIQYLYTTENQLKEVRYFENSSSQSRWKTVQYYYDAIGRRILKRVTNTLDPSKDLERRFVYDGNSVLHEYDGANSLLARYTHPPQAGDQIVDAVLGVRVTAAGVSAGIAAAAGSYTFLKDALGTVTAVTDTSGNKLLELVYSAFGSVLAVRDALGNELSGILPLNSAYAFTGRELDRETDLYYFRSRYYDPSIGQFLQRDSDPGVTGDPITHVNGHIALGNNPIVNVDPTGKFFFLLPLLAILGAGAAIATGINAAITGRWDWDFFTEAFFAGLSAVVGLAVAVVTVAAAALTGPAGLLIAIGVGTLTAGATNAFLYWITGRNAGKGFLIGLGAGLVATSIGFAVLVTAGSPAVLPIVAGAAMPAGQVFGWAVSLIGGGALALSEACKNNQCTSN